MDKFRAWFDEVKILYFERGMGGLAVTERWHELYEDGKSPEAALQTFLDENDEV